MGPVLFDTCDWESHNPEVFCHAHRAFKRNSDLSVTSTGEIVQNELLFFFGLSTEKKLNKNTTANLSGVKMMQDKHEPTLVIPS